MSASSPQRTAESVDDRDSTGTAYDDGTGDGTGSRFPEWALHWWPALQRRADDEAEPAEDERGFLGGRLATLLIVGGAILFVLPEPITSVLGVLAVAAGVVTWLGGKLL